MFKTYLREHKRSPRSSTATFASFSLLAADSGTLVSVSKDTKCGFKPFFLLVDVSWGVIYNPRLTLWDERSFKYPKTMFALLTSTKREPRQYHRNITSKHCTKNCIGMLCISYVFNNITEIKFDSQSLSPLKLFLSITDSLE